MSWTGINKDFQVQYPGISCLISVWNFIRIWVSRESCYLNEMSEMVWYISKKCYGHLCFGNRIPFLWWVPPPLGSAVNDVDIHVEGGCILSGDPVDSPWHLEPDSLDQMSTSILRINEPCSKLLWLAWEPMVTCCHGHIQVNRVNPTLSLNEAIYGHTVLRWSVLFS